MILWREKSKIIHQKVTGANKQFSKFAHRKQMALFVHTFNENHKRNLKNHYQEPVVLAHFMWE
jgi:hypothetical protein